MRTLFRKTLVKVGYAVASLFLVATQAQAETYYFHNDQLGTPQVVTDSQQQVAWKGEYDPFGECIEVVDLIEQNLRFPGQYFDQETGLHYNLHRTYDPNTGRYIESDPIGLVAGVSTYGYALQNPVKYFDPTGEIPLLVLVPILSGLANGLIEVFEEAITCDVSDDATGTIANRSFKAFGRGFVSGAGGSLAGLGTLALTGNVAVAGGVAGGVGSGINEVISGGDSIGTSIAVGTAAGVIGGRVAAKIIPKRKPKLLSPRGLNNFDDDSGFLTLQNVLETTITGIIGTAVGSSGNDECDCN